MKILTLAAIALFPLVLTAAGPSVPEYREEQIVDFSEASGTLWRPVNDNVMGGRSLGKARIEKGNLLFAGETRLENNGGFASVRSARTSWDLSGAGELLVRVRGTTSRKYTMLLETSERLRWGRVSYWQGFELPVEGWQIVRLPLSGFVPNFRGRQLEGRELDTSDIRSIGFMVYDKKAAEFEMEIDWVKASWVSDPPAAATSATPVAAASAEPNLVDLAKKSGKFDILLTAAQKAGLVDTLTSAGPFTVLAPTDEAFGALPEGTLTALLRPENLDQLKAILLLHVIPGKQRAQDLLAAGTVATVLGQELKFGLTAGRLTAGESNIILNDLAASNGIVHAIDRVLLPEPEAETNPALRLMEVAVSKGVEEFNDGDAAACAAIYEITVMALIELENAGLTPAAIKRLDGALRVARKADDAREAAWTLRLAMDATRNELSN